MEKHQQIDENTATIADGDLTAETSETNHGTDPAPAEVDPTDEAFLARVASEIHALSEDDGENLEKAGRLLAEAKQRLPQDQWLALLEHEFGWSQDEASKLIELHEASVDLERCRDWHRNSAAVAAYYDAWGKLPRIRREAQEALQYGVGLSLGCRGRGLLDFDEILRQQAELANASTE